MQASLATVPPVLLDPSLNQRGFNHIAFSQDGLLRATGDVAMMVEVRDAESLLWHRWVGSHDAKVRVTQRIRAVEFSADGTFLFVGSADHLYAFVARTGELAWEYVAPRSFGFLVISPIAISVAESDDVAVSFDNGRLRFLKASGELLGQWKDVDVQQHIALLKDDRRLVGADTGLNVFDLYQRRKISRVRLPERALAMAVGGPKEQVAVRTLHDLVVVNLERHEIVSQMPTRRGFPLVAFHPTEPLIAASDEFGVTLVDTECETKQRIEVEAAKVLSLRFTPDGKSLAVGCTDHVVRTYEI